jgi:uncharacterized protein with PIN domain
MSNDAEARTFIVDNMLGSLARWLRMLGYDSRYDKALNDDQILAAAKSEGRIILTRDRELAERGGGLCLETTDLDEQLSAVSESYSLTYGADRMRCSVCNGRLLEIPRERAKELVPERSFESSSEFWVCESCKKAYWDGTHWKGIMDKFRKLGLAEGSG